MVQVSNQTQLLAALASQDLVIQVIDDFAIATQINILYPVTIESLTAAAPFTLTKDSSYFTYLFRVQNGGVLTLQNIILDGDKENHPIDNQNNRSLIYVTGGTLNLLDGSVLRNNNAYLEGGGIYLNRNEAYPNTLSMKGNALITGCYSRTNGGGSCWQREIHRILFLSAANRRLMGIRALTEAVSGFQALGMKTLLLLY